jgi:hypothetical protein
MQPQFGGVHPSEGLAPAVSTRLRRGDCSYDGAGHGVSRGLVVAVQSIRLSAGGECERLSERQCRV